MIVPANFLGVDPYVVTAWRHHSHTDAVDDELLMPRADTDDELPKPLANHLTVLHDRQLRTTTSADDADEIRISWVFSLPDDSGPLNHRYVVELHELRSSATRLVFDGRPPENSLNIDCGAPVVLFRAGRHLISEMSVRHKRQEANLRLDLTAPKGSSAGEINTTCRLVSFREGSDRVELSRSVGTTTVSMVLLVR